MADFDWRRHDGVLFDLDGVITPTAEIHEHAWGELFADFDYTEADYLRYIDGKPRYDGVRSFLASRNVTLPEGDPTDAPGTGTVCAMGNRKNELFNVILERDGIAPYPGSLATLDLLDEAAIPSAIVSSSKNAGRVLDAAGLGERFEVSSTARSPPPNTSRASRLPTCTWWRPDESASRPSAPSSSKMPSRASPPVPPADSTS